VLARTQLRALAVVPVFFSFIGISVIAFTLLFRRLWSPVPGIGVGAVVVVASAVAVAALWRASPRAPVALMTSGAVTLVAYLLLDRLFPLVQASSEPPPPFAQYWYPANLVAIVVLTIASAWGARVCLRRAVNER
jgi:hypothetical protein